MKKKLFIPLLCLCLVLMTACGKNNAISDNTSNVQDSSSIEETSESKDIKENKDNTDDVSEKQIGFEELNEAVSTDVEDTISAIKLEYEKLVTEIDTYEMYLESTDKVEACSVRQHTDSKRCALTVHNINILILCHIFCQIRALNRSA